MVFVDIADLEAVAQDTKSYDSVNGYAVYNLQNDWGTPSGTGLDRYGANEACGIAYDETRRILYVCQANGNDTNGHPNPAWPVVHVYQVTASGDITPPASPVNLSVQ
jgi:hypothetical protein